MLDFKLLSGGDVKRPRSSGGTLSGRRRVHPSETAANHADTIQHVLDAPNDSALLSFTGGVRDYVHDVTAMSNWLTPDWHPAETAENDLVDVLMDLGKYEYSHVLTQAIGLTHRLFSSRNDLFDDAVQAQLLVTPRSVQLARQLEDQVSELRRLTRGFVEHSETDQFLAIVPALEKECYIEPENVEFSQAHEINQSIIVNAGVVDILFDVLSRYGQNDRVLNASFRLLRGLAVENPPVQQLLFDNIEKMLNHPREGEWQNDMAFCLAEAFTKNKTLCLSIRSEHLEMIMGLLREKTQDAPQLLSLLAAVVKAEELDLPLKRNQDMIVRFLMEYRSLIIAPAHIDDNSDAAINEARLALLREEFPSDADLRLRQYHCGLVQLLAGCAEGENKYIESMCQTIFSIEEILEVLEDELINPLFKGPYMEFLVWVYLNTGEPSDELINAHLEREMRLWEPLARLGSSSSFVKKGVLGAEELRFMLDSFIPLVTKLTKDYYVPEASPAVTRSVGKLAKGMAEFGMKALELVGDRSLVKRIASCIMVLATKAPGHVTQATLDQLAARLTAQDAGIVDLPAVQKYYEYYVEEIKLNHDFNEYARRMKLAYGGANTLKAQLLHGHGKEDGGARYCEEPHEDEPLPLFPEFQREMEVFCELGDVRGAVVPIRCKPSVSQLIRQLSAVVDDDTTELDFRTLHRRTNLNCRTLQLLRAILHNALVLDRPTGTLQDDLTLAVLPVMFLLQEPNEEVQREALCALAAMLTDGHDGAQAQIERYFLSTREELFFEVVQSKIKNAMEMTQELRSLRQQLEIKASTHEKLLGTLTLAGQLGNQVSDALGSVRSISGDVAETIMSTSKQANKTKKDGADLGFVDTGNMELVLRVMQLMCEGYNLTLKQYLQKQEDNIRSIDLVAETVTFLQMCIDEVNQDNIGLIIQVGCLVLVGQLLGWLLWLWLWWWCSFVWLGLTIRCRLHALLV